MQAILDSPPVFDVPLQQHALSTPPPTVHTLAAELPVESPLTALELASNTDEVYSYLTQPCADHDLEHQPRWLSDFELDMGILEAPTRGGSTLMGSIDADGWYVPPSPPWEEADQKSNTSYAPQHLPLSPLSSLDIPHQYSHHTPPPSYSSPSLPLSYLRSPFLGSLPDLDDDLGFDFDFESPPSSPSSLHSTSSLPDDEDGLEFSCTMDVDGLSKSYCPTNLLLIDDEEDAPSSPSSIASSSLEAEFEAELESSLDPTVIQLCAIRNRAMLAERAARHVESISVGCAAAEARRTRKSEKAKAREVSTLLRLKLCEETVLSSPGYEDDEPLPHCGDYLPARGEALACKKKKGEMASITELVAKMLFRRHEVVRPLADRARPLSHINPRTPSSLSISVN